MTWNDWNEKSVDVAWLRGRVKETNGNEKNDAGNTEGKENSGNERKRKKEHEFQVRELIVMERDDGNEEVG